jgi:hypothetical protein
VCVCGQDRERRAQLLRLANALLRIDQRDSRAVEGEIRQFPAGDGRGPPIGPPIEPSHGLSAQKLIELFLQRTVHRTSIHDIAGADKSALHCRSGSVQLRGVGQHDALWLGSVHGAFGLISRGIPKARVPA